MKIQTSTAANDNQFRDFWNAAIAYQTLNQLPLWPAYPEQKIKAEIQAGLHFSVFMPDNVLAGYFSLALADELIWGEKEQGDAIYIHRMCVNPARKGNNLTASVLAWAGGYARSSGRKFVRMDTWGDNQRLVDYYIACGFRHIGNRRLGAAPGLLPHYNNIHLALFENAVDSDFIIVPKKPVKPKDTSPGALARGWFDSIQITSPNTLARLREQVQHKLETKACRHLLPKMASEHLADAELQQCGEHVITEQWDSLTPEERLIVRFPTIQAVGQYFDIPKRGRGLIIQRELTRHFGVEMVFQLPDGSFFKWVFID